MKGSTKEIPYYDNSVVLEKNEGFFNYYVNQNIIKKEEIDNFMEIINKELPITFRVLKNNKYSDYIHENIKKKLECICKDNYSIIKLNEEDHMYEIYITRSQIKKNENYKNLCSYLINLNESGYIFRQELVSMLPILFLKLKENFFVLDICAAPGSKTAQIVDYMHLINKKNVKNYLIKKFIQKNCSSINNLRENAGNQDSDSCCSDIRDSEGINSIEGSNGYNDDEYAYMCGNRSTKFSGRTPVEGNVKTNEHKNVKENDEGERNKTDTENIYKSYYTILDNNLYDEKLFEYILNVDNNLYNDYKKLISNNNPTGVVVANDANFKRCCMLFHRLKNIHSNCLVVTNNNAINFPYIYIKNGKENKVEKKFFDSVLCDVPCSGDGTLRKDRNIWLNWNPLNAYNLFQVQVNILKRSIELTKENGVIVYSTCSLNPIENEAVICEIFNSVENFNCLKLINFENELITKLNFKEGITQWRVLIDDIWFDTYQQFCDYLKNKESSKYKKIYDKIQNGMFTPPKEFIELINLKYVKRFFPHHYNAGGFFIAVIKKCGKLKWKEKAKRENMNKCIVNKNVISNRNKLEKGELRKKYKNRKYKKSNKKKKNKNGDLSFNGYNIKQNFSREIENEQRKILEIKNNSPEQVIQNGLRKSCSPVNSDGSVMDDEHIEKNYNVVNHDLIMKNYKVIDNINDTRNYQVIGDGDITKNYNNEENGNVTKNDNLEENDNFEKNYNVIDSDFIISSCPIRRPHETSKGDVIINLINRKSEEKLNNYSKNEMDSSVEYTEQYDILKENNKTANGYVKPKGSVQTKCKVEDQIYMGNEKLTKQQEYVSLDYYEKLFCINDTLERIKNYFNLNEEFLSIKSNLYIHLKDDSNFCKLSINERINSNIKKINFVSNYTKDILECYTKIKLKIISAGITVIQIDKNKKNKVENYYRINYSGCLNFVPFFKDVDAFLLNKIYRKEIIKNYFSPIYENKNRVFHFESYMNQLIGERKSTLSKGTTNNTKVVKNVGENTHPASYVNNEKITNSLGGEENLSEEKNKHNKYSDETEKKNMNTIWVKSDVILDLIKVDKSKINNITNETIKQTEKLTKYSPNILLTLNKNKQILAIPSNKGNLYVDISIDKNSIIMLPYILN
ncbi:tRNA m5C-methyltransferase, putative [Plasmodium malariae]|uniref:tRNA m5C-methyltransferase, putative n=1 Tax=Plasmodium malariae TaxID=5858 RepID=A0A1D3JK20_PLAMA|nr:tRNA m5C-methyltransferase, putative [Plasmodium malariae]SBT86868.1 tRNA m5C-methyltransferase, putative [Plasmodium malariae]